MLTSWVMRRGPCHDFGNVHLYAEAPSYLVYVGRKVGLSSRVLLSLPLRLRPSRCHVDGAPFRPTQGPEAPILTLTLRNAGPEQGSYPRARISQLFSGGRTDAPSPAFLPRPSPSTTDVAPVW